MILCVQFQRLGHQYTMLCSVSNINATNDECQGILNCCILYNWYIMHSQKLLCTISWIRSSGIRHCQRRNGPAQKLFRFYLTGAWQTFSGRFTTFLDESFAIFTDSIIVSSADCMGGPYEKELLKGLLTDYERYICSPLYPTNQKTIIKYRFLLVSLFKLFWFQAKPACAERVFPSCAHIWSHPSTDHRCGGSGRHLKIFWLI